MNAADHSSHGPKNSLHLRGHPHMLADIGTSALLYILVATSLLGAALTWAFRIETAGVSLDAVGAEAETDAPAGAGLKPVAPLAWASADGSSPKQ
ncbi:MAG: hypothetical protein U1E81_03495 [Xanthobacteraceae bacterium]